MDKIYCVKAISLSEYSEEKLRERYKITKIEHPVWQEKTFEDYLNFLKGWKDDKYLTDSFISSYHTKRNDAIKCVTENIGDINEAGSYNYAAILPVPLNTVYPESNVSYDDVKFFKFNRESEKYEEITDKSIPEYETLCIEATGYISFQNKEIER